MTRDLLQKMLDELSGKTIADLKAMLGDPTLPAIKAYVIAVLLKGISKGDAGALESILTAMLGPQDEDW